MNLSIARRHKNSGRWKAALMPTATIKRYWDWLPDLCPCGARSECIHHIIHVNWQRITKDDWLVCKLCNACHRLLHSFGGDRQFEEQAGYSTVHLAVLNRHNYEVRELRRAA